jgi:1-phosphofructokinase family hexose kinase
MSRPGKILCLGTTPAAQRVMVFHRLTLDAVNRAATTSDGAAGKSINVAKVLHALGERPLATGFLGGDRGDFLRETLRERGIETDFVNVATRTRQCVTVIDEAAGTVTELVEESRPVEAAAFGELLARIERHLPDCRAVVMSGTITAGGPADLYRRVTELARAQGLLTVVDAQGPPLLEALAAGPDLVKPNRAELAASLGRELPDEAGVLRALRELAGRGARRAVVTAGAGATLAFDGARGWRITAPRVKALNPIGSGDAFTAAATARLLRGDDLGEACRWGAAAGTANVLTPMAGEVDPATVERLAATVSVEWVG